MLSTTGSKLPVTDPGELPGGPGTPLIFRPNRGAKGRKTIFGDRSPLPSPLSQGLDEALITTCIYWHGY